MGHKLTAAQWTNIKHLFESETRALPEIVVNIHSPLFKPRSWKRILGPKKAIKLELSTALTDMIEWCEECIEGQFYAEKHRLKIDHRYQEIPNEVVFRFLDENDAILFKLTWWGN